MRKESIKCAYTAEKYSRVVGMINHKLHRLSSRQYPALVKEPAISFPYTPGMYGLNNMSADKESQLWDLTPIKGLSAKQMAEKLVHNGVTPIGGSLNDLQDILDECLAAFENEYCEETGKIIVSKPVNTGNRLYDCPFCGKSHETSI